MDSSNSLKAFLRDCRVDLRVGIHAHEKQKPQPVIVNVEVEMALTQHYRDLSEDKLDRVLNYESIYRFIHDDLPKLGHIPLLESMAEQIMDFCFRDARVRSVRVRLEKPGVFHGVAGAGIDMRRVRGQE